MLLLARMPKLTKQSQQRIRGIPQDLRDKKLDCIHSGIAPNIAMRFAGRDYLAVLQLVRSEMSTTSIPSPEQCLP